MRTALVFVLCSSLTLVCERTFVLSVPATVLPRMTVCALLMLLLWHNGDITTCVLPCVVSVAGSFGYPLQVVT